MTNTHKILVVDDEVDIESLVLQKFRHRLSTGELQFNFAHNGIEALDVLGRDVEVDLIVCDINMPQMDGLTLLSKIKEKYITKKTIIISAYGNMENIRIAMNRGAFDFIIKPIDFSDFEITLNKAIEETIKIKESEQIRKQLEEERKHKEELILKHSAELEMKVEERTSQVILQKQLIEAKHKEITDSIAYAERIQKSFLASKENLEKHLGEYFVFYMPRNIVSGDFYLVNELSNGEFVIATCDSTGHGVPGAIMSLLNIASLEKALEYHQQPAEILNHTRRTVIERLRKDGSLEGGKDGMDCSLICFDFKNNKLKYAAANNVIYIVRENSAAEFELIELRPDRMPVGKHENDAISFSQNEIEIAKGDIIYTLTDGMPDQFGGPQGKKFMYKRLKELLVNIAGKPMGDQKELLQTALKEWMGENEQVDDITVIGIRV